MPITNSSRQGGWTCYLLENLDSDGRDVSSIVYICDLPSSGSSAVKNAVEAVYQAEVWKSKAFVGRTVLETRLACAEDLGSGEADRFRNPYGLRLVPTSEFSAYLEGNAFTDPQTLIKLVKQYLKDDGPPPPAPERGARETTPRPQRQAKQQDVDETKQRLARLEERLDTSIKRQELLIEAISNNDRSQVTQAVRGLRQGGDDSEDDEDNPFANPLDDGKATKKLLDDKITDPRVGIEDVIVPDDLRENILATVEGVANWNRIFDEWGFGETIEKGKGSTFLFAGVPGTGKTMMAEAIAQILGRKVWIVRSSELFGMFVGDFEKRVGYIFKKAQKENLVVVLDECDSIVQSREREGQNGEVYSANSLMSSEVNTLLGCLEEFDGVCVLTTNRVVTLDDALERRVSLVVEFPFPSVEHRELIWRRLIPTKCPVKDVDFAALAKFELAGGHIKKAVLLAARKASRAKADGLDQATLLEAVKEVIKGQKTFRGQQGKPLLQTPPDELSRVFQGSSNPWLN